MTNPKITRKDAEYALRVVLNDFECNLDGAAPGYGGAVGKKYRDLLAILRQCRIIEPGGLDAETLREAARVVAAHRDKYPLSVFPNNLTKHAKVLRENGLAIDRISAENHRQASVAMEDELISRADAIEKGE